jgi:hypothetical protein
MLSMQAEFYVLAGNAVSALIINNYLSANGIGIASWRRCIATSKNSINFSILQGYSR